MELRKLKESDWPGMLEWLLDPEVNCFFRFTTDNMNKESTISFIKNANFLFEERKAFHLAIVDAKDEYLGTISLKDVDYDAKTAEYAISLRRSAQGNGIGKLATKQILEYAFEELKLNRVYLNVLSNNVVAQNLYKGCGFSYEGEFKDHVKVKGKIESLQWYAILRKDYEKIKEKEYENNA